MLGHPSSRTVLSKSVQKPIFFGAVLLGVTKRAEMLTNSGEPAETRRKWPPAGVEGDCLAGQGGQRSNRGDGQLANWRKLKGLRRRRNRQLRAAVTFKGRELAPRALPERNTSHSPTRETLVSIWFSMGSVKSRTQSEEPALFGSCFAWMAKKPSRSRSAPSCEIGAGWVTVLTP